MEWINIKTKRPDEGQAILLVRQIDTYLSCKLIQQELCTPYMARAVDDVLDDEKQEIDSENYIISRVAYWYPFPEFDSLQLIDATEE